ncbi:hypothetical protein CA265_11500 [Sphingobacteriaceae bacterium GW460-11-11-14-LB5]|nr:hypothetical protein CA265_11500 [Sphingobacteriaceae bacterium GW460-11-11-14-LB5]
MGAAANDDLMEVRIESFNPYESRFPNRRVITRDALMLAKTLRAEGYKVVIEPDNGLPVYYLYSKGLREWFADPVNLLLFNIPITVITNLITNQVQKLLDWNDKQPSHNLNIQTDGSSISYNYLGLEQPVGNKQRITTIRKELKDGFDRCFNTIPPNIKFPTPIYLEHKPKIVGWCRLWEDERGLASEGYITDKLVKRRIAQNRLNGASVTGMASRTLCSICSSSYLNCNHIAGNEYEGQSCSNVIIETDFVETSLVKTPINPQCILGWQ